MASKNAVVCVRISNQSDHRIEFAQVNRHPDVTYSRLINGLAGVPFVGTIAGGDVTMTTNSSVVHSDPDILGGTPVFVGTRVPVRTLLDYLAAGDTLEEFLDHFPTVSREQAVAVLEQANDLLVAQPTDAIND